MKDKIFYIIKLIFILIALYIMNIINFTNISPYIILLLVILLLNYKIKTKNDKITIIFSIIFSIFLSFGNLTILNYKLNYFFIVIIELIGNYFLVNKILLILYDKISNIKFKKFNKNLSNKKVFIITILIGLICFLPYYLCYFPGILSYDSYYQLAQVVGNVPYTNAHPILHTMLIKVIYAITYRITNSSTISTGMYTFVQMLIAIITISYAITTLYKNKINKKFIIAILLFMFINPINGLYSITIWKDILFSYAVLAFSIFLWDFYRNNKEWNKINIVSFIILSILMCLLRNNGFIAYIIFICFFFILYKKELFKVKFPIIITIVIVIIFNFTINNVLKIQNSDLVESLSIPIQQIAYVIKNNGNISKSEMLELKKVCNIKQLKSERKIEEYYHISDNNKTNIRLNNPNGYLENNKLKYLKLYIKLGLKNPKMYIVAYVKQTSGYWYHNYGEYWVYSEEFTKTGPHGDININRNVILPKSIKKTISSFAEKYVDIYYQIGSLALFLYIIILGIYIGLKDKNNILCHLPTVTIIITLLIATPVASEFRYAYSLFLYFPFSIVIFLNKKNKANKN